MWASEWFSTVLPKIYLLDEDEKGQASCCFPCWRYLCLMSKAEQSLGSCCKCHTCVSHIYVRLPHTIQLYELSFYFRVKFCSSHSCRLDWYQPSLFIWLELLSRCSSLILCWSLGAGVRAILGVIVLVGIVSRVLSSPLSGAVLLLY